MKRIIVALAIISMLLVLMPAVAGAQQADEWSQYQKDVAHTGAIDLKLPTTNRVARRTPDVKARGASEPVVAGSKAYLNAGLSSGSSAVYCYDLSTGKELWHTTVATVSFYESWSSPAVADGVVYVGSGSCVQALNADTGKLLWTKDLRTYLPGSHIVNSSPAVDGRYLVIGNYGNGSGGGGYYCLDVTQKGKLLWKFDCDASCTAMSTPCITGGRVFVGQSAAWMAPISPNGKVWCLDEATGKKVASWGTNGSFTTIDRLNVGGTVTAFGDYIYFTDINDDAGSTPNSHLYCLSKDTGASKWSAPVYGSDGAPSVEDGLIITTGQQPPDTNWIAAFSADTTSGANPKQIWAKSGMGGQTMSPCIAGDKVAVGDTYLDVTTFTCYGENTFVLDKETGKTLWHSTEGGSSPVPTPYGLLSIADGKMVTFGTGSLPSGEFYFAEGTTRDGYHEWICLLNPTGGEVTCGIEYMINGGSNKKQDIVLPPNSRTTVDVNLFLGPGLDVSARVTGDGYFVAERSVYFTADGRDGGEQVLGRTGTSTRFMFAEGTTRAGFQTWLAVQNPQDTEAKVLVNYIYADGTPPTPQNVTVPPRSRQTIDVNTEAGAEKDVSMAVTSNRSIVAERVMYFTYPNRILGMYPSGVHNCTGADAGARSWYFAEGTTRSNFQEWLCLMNPTGNEAAVTIRYMKAAGSVQTVEKTLKANSRDTIDVNADVGPDADVSALVTSSEPIVAERPMYFQFMPEAGVNWKGGHNSIGAEYAAYRWEFAEGCTREGFKTYLCIANPNATDEEVTISYFMTNADGEKRTVEKKVTVAANERRTVVVNDEVGADADVSASVSCRLPIVCERPMYFSFSGYTDGGCALGYPGAL